MTFHELILSSFCRIKTKDTTEDVLLRKIPFSCDEISTACPPCTHHKNDRRQLLSKIPFDGKYGKCTFNGTILTIPQIPSDHNHKNGYYVIFARERIDNTKHVMAIIEDIENKSYNVSEA